MNKICILFFLLCYTFLFSQNRELFNEATGFYNSNQYTEALSRYKQILENGMDSKDLYYNIGNVYYKMDSIGLSIYYYEKALKINPKDEDILNNLSIARQKTVDVIEDLPESLIHSLVSRVTFLHYDVWAVWSIVFMSLFFIYFLLYFFSNRVSYKKVFFIIGFIFFSLSIASWSSAYYKYDLYKIKYAIILPEVVEFREAPNFSANKLFDLHEGTKVQVLEDLGDWNKVRISNGKTGWLISSNISIY